MEKEILMINGKEITIMEQPASIILDWERRYANDIVDYVAKILEYPQGKNPKIDEIFDLENKIAYDDIEVEFKDSISYLKFCEKLFKVGGSNFAFIAEHFLKEAKKDINSFKYKELRKMGKEIAEGMLFFADYIKILETFRNI